MGTTDLFEDIKISGAFRIAANLRDNDVLFEFNNLRKRLDWGFTYYRSNLETAVAPDRNNPNFRVGAKQFSNYYLGKLTYPLDRVRSIRATVGPRFDRYVYPGSDITTLKLKDSL